MSELSPAAAIRKALKEKHGWNSRQVSVRTSRGSAINVEVKDPNVPLKIVEEEAKAHEKVDRCPYSHDILAGGNTFVFVKYAKEAIAPKAQEVLAQLSDEPGKIVTIEGLEVWRLNDPSRSYAQDEWWWWKAGAECGVPDRAHGKGWAAERVAIALLNGEGA